MELDPSAFERVDRYFAEEDFRPVTREEFDRLDLPEESATDSDDSIRTYYDAMAPHYERCVGNHFGIERKANAYLYSLVAALRPRTVFDAGCGTGLTLGFLATEFPTIRFLGYDLSEVMLEEVRSRIKMRGIGNVALDRGSHEEMARVHPGSADLVIGKCSLCELPWMPDFRTMPMPAEEAVAEIVADYPPARCWERSLRAFARMLRPEGVYVSVGMSHIGVVVFLNEIARRAELGTADDLVHVIEEPDPTDYLEHSVRADVFRK